ncbi:MAG TPA: YjdF family protein [Candidatus Wallbacteria bacterium]|nr:YjdF family protein [Candidatus Wallbacteria bacterium]
MSIKLTVLFEGAFWVGIFEKNDECGYSAARYVFGSEPKNEDVYQFVLSYYHKLVSSKPLNNNDYKPKKVNPKRLNRMISREIESGVKLNKAYSAIREQREKNKKIKKVISKREKEDQKKMRFDLKQIKKKMKMKGR